MYCVPRFSSNCLKIYSALLKSLKYIFHHYNSLLNVLNKYRYKELQIKYATSFCQVKSGHLLIKFGSKLTFFISKFWFAFYKEIFTLQLKKTARVPKGFTLRNIKNKSKPYYSNYKKMKYLWSLDLFSGNYRAKK